VERELIAEIKKSLAQMAEKDPTWKLFLGNETLTAQQLIERIDNDRKLRQLLLRHYLGVAVEMEIRGRRTRDLLE